MLEEGYVMEKCMAVMGFEDLAEGWDASQFPIVCGVMQSG